MDGDRLSISFSGTKSDLEILTNLGRGSLVLPETGMEKLVSAVALERLVAIVEDLPESENLQLIQNGLKILLSHPDLTKKVDTTAGKKLFGFKVVSELSEEAGGRVKAIEERELQFLDATLVGALLKKSFSIEDLDGKSALSREAIRAAIEHASALHQSGVKPFSDEERALFKSNLVKLCLHLGDLELIEEASKVLIQSSAPMKGIEGVKSALNGLINIDFIEPSFFKTLAKVLSAGDEAELDKKMIAYIYKCKLLQIGSMGEERVASGNRGVLTDEMIILQGEMLPWVDMAGLSNSLEGQQLTKFTFFLREQIFPTNTQAVDLAFDEFIEPASSERKRHLTYLASEEKYITSKPFFDPLRSYFRHKSGYKRRYSDVSTLWEKNSLIRAPKDPNLFHLEMEVVAPPKFSRKEQVDIDLSSFKDLKTGALSEPERKLLLGLIKNRKQVEALLTKNEKPKGLERLSDRQMDLLFNTALQVENEIDMKLSKLLRLPPTPT